MPTPAPLQANSQKLHQKQNQRFSKTKQITDKEQLREREKAVTDTTAFTGANNAGTGKGLTIDRIYTTEGVHPYDQVSWEYRDVVQTNWKNGEVIFEQRGVEFPEFWSINASTIVTTKYFRGAQGTPEREYSLRQLINRVVHTYTEAGRKFGYFANEEDAVIFDHELTYMLLNQVFSFNSPVWFNVGTKSPQQVSACFILSVDDSMESILNWYREEGMIFKGGSGAGLNLSRIRSTRNCSRTRVARLRVQFRSCAVQTPLQEPSSRVALPVVQPRWLFST